MSNKSIMIKTKMVSDSTCGNFVVMKRSMNNFVFCGVVGRKIVSRLLFAISVASDIRYKIVARCQDHERGQQEL